MSPSRTCKRSVLVVLPLLLWHVSGSSKADDTSGYDCGVRALYTMFRLEGRPKDLAEIAAVLPPPQLNGHAMRDLQRAAGRLGMPLTGLRLNSTPASLDRLMLLFLDEGDHGHYVIGRPVGYTGTLFQIIDSNQPTYVIDKADLVAARMWTGFVLVDSGSIGMSFGIKACLLGALGVAVPLSMRRNQRAAV